MSLIDKIRERKLNQKFSSGQPATTEAAASPSADTGQARPPATGEGVGEAEAVALKISIAKTSATEINFDRWYFFEIALPAGGTHQVFEAPGLHPFERYREWKEFEQRELGLRGREHLQSPKLDPRRTIGYLERIAHLAGGAAAAGSGGPVGDGGGQSNHPSIKGHAAAPCHVCGLHVFWLDPYGALHCSNCQPCLVAAMMRLRVRCVPTLGPRGQVAAALADLFGDVDAVAPPAAEAVWTWEKARWQGWRTPERIKD